MSWFVVLPYLILLHIMLLFNFPSHTFSLCNPRDLSALLLFNNSFTVNNTLADYYDYCPKNVSSKTASWNKNRECCEWDGVTCGKMSGHVIGLDLSCSMLQGEFHPNTTLFHLTHLRHLNLAYNHFYGDIPSSISRLSKLISLDFSNNYMGNYPYFYSYDHSITMRLDPFTIENLTYLDLSSNNFSGLVDFKQFTKFKNLQYLDLSHNNFLSLNINNSVDHLLPSLEILQLSYCTINTFPKFIARLQNLRILDLSDCKIHGNIPKWFYEKLLHFWKKIVYIDISFNQLEGDLPIPPDGLEYFVLSNNNLSGDISSAICNASSLLMLDLSHNNLSGMIPQCLGYLPNLFLLDLQRNNLHGDISSTICNASSLNILSLSHNNLSGMIPQCLGHIPRLFVLDLQRNNFHGYMPRNFLKGNDLETIKLNGNRLEGPLPQSLVNCKNLQVLDLGDNNIVDIFPIWLETLPELQVLVLRSNKFYGVITCSGTKNPFPKLRIFDVSINHFSGPLPASCIKNFQGMRNVNYNETGSKYMTNHGSYYRISVVVIIKGEYRELVRILTSFTMIDLSINMFEGDIPTAIGELSSLIGLNLSHNGITGTIPRSFDNLTSLEWLDLSRNKLTGEIPMALMKLNFLSVLNLSQNQLKGMIPKGGQFNTFENVSYEGNPMLCGFPLSKTCNNEDEHSPQLTSNHEEESGFGWKSVVVGYASGVVFGMGLGYIVFFTGKPQWLARLLGAIPDTRVRRTSIQAHANNR